MLLSIANLTNGLKGLKHSDDVPAHRFQAAGREPQATRRCRCSTKLVVSEHLLCQKYQQSKGEYRVYSARLMAGGVILHKAIFVCKTRGRRMSTNQNILKGDRERHLQNICHHIWYPPSHHHRTLSRMTPSYPWGGDPSCEMRITLVDIKMMINYSEMPLSYPLLKYSD